MKIKKILIYLITVLGLLFPNSLVYAIKVSNVRMGKVDAVTDTFELPIYIDFSGVSLKDANSFGIAGVTVDLVYDDTIFDIVGILAKGFDSEVIKKNDEKHIVSIITNSKNLENTCMDNILYCEQYNAIVTFKVKETTETSSMITIGEVTILGYQLDATKKIKYNKDEIKEIDFTANKTQTIEISKGEKKNDSKSIIKSGEYSISKITDSVISRLSEKNSKTGDISDNNYLKELSVKGYLIDFYKDKNDYEISVLKGLNSLKVTAIAEDENAVVNIIGATNLKQNNYKVLIEVTSQMGNKNVYTINVIDDEEITDNTSLIDKIKKIYKDYKIYIIGLGICLVLALIIIFIVNKINDHNINNKISL